MSTKLLEQVHSPWSKWKLFACGVRSKVLWFGEGKQLEPNIKWKV